jgi:alpha-glucosidase
MDPGSTLNFFRHALATRSRVVPELGPSVRFGDARPGVLVYHRDPGFTCVVNCSSRPYDVSGYGDPLITSADAATVAGGVLPPDSAAWYQT